jgi:hypothetical protein
MAPTAVQRTSAGTFELDHETIQALRKIAEIAAEERIQKEKSCEHKKKEERPIVKKKERFHVIDSPFTTAVQDDSAVRSIYSCIVAMMTFHLIATCVKYYFMDGLLQSDIAFLRNSFSGFHWVLLSEFALFTTFMFMIVPAVQFRMQERISPFLFYTNLLVSALIMTLIPLYFRYAMDLSVVAAIAVIFEQIRYAMKVISFVIENEKISAETEDDVFPEIPTVKSSLYFLFAPTLIYQPTYPMRQSRDWKNILCWSLEIVALAWSTMTVLNHGFIDTFAGIGAREMTPEDWCSMFVQSAVAGASIMVGIGYGFLHCWNNIWGELLYFGDRTFYKNFFSCGNVYVMFSKWNFLIHSWIVEYLFKPVVRRTRSGVAASATAFIVSMAFHDYAVSVPLRIWSGQYFANTCMIFLGAPLILSVHSYLTKHPFPSKLNVSMWFLICFGTTSMTMTAAMKYFHQQNCPHEPLTLIAFLNGFPDASICQQNVLMH